LGTKKTGAETQLVTLGGGQKKKTEEKIMQVTEGKSEDRDLQTN